MIKVPRGKLSISITTFGICALAFIALLYNETISSLSSSSLLKFKTCSRKTPAHSESGNIVDKSIEKESDEVEEDNKLEFDPDICDITDGKWVFNTSTEPFYTDGSCPYLDKQVSCVKNGRPDSDYLHWEWQPDDCTLPRFNPKQALRKLRGKRLMFVGDSLQRGQWQSFVCLVESFIHDDKKSIKRGAALSVFRAEEYNCTIEFYWAPFIIQSNSDAHIIGDPKQRILRVDSVAEHAEHWLDVDILVFGTYVWWMSGLKLKTLWGSFSNGEEGYEELDTPVAYRIGMKTWANWIDSTVNPNKTRVFFTSMSPTHTSRWRHRYVEEENLIVLDNLSGSRGKIDMKIEMCPVLLSRANPRGSLVRIKRRKSEDWQRMDGIQCFNETKPVTKKGHWGTGSNKQMMNVVVDVLRKMKVPVTVINITQLSEYRIDGHATVYTETGGKLLTDEQKADPSHYADCIHWCLPGVPDSWNQIFLSFL